MSVGGVAVFPADTVYGLACDPDSREAVERLYLLKRRRPDKPAAVMFFDVELALAALPELGARTRKALAAVRPGALTLLLPNPARRFPLAGGEALGLRVPDGQLRGVRGAGLQSGGERAGGAGPRGRPAQQSSANRSGGPDPRRLDDVPELLRDSAVLVLDADDLPGTPSTVI